MKQNFAKTIVLFTVLSSTGVWCQTPVKKPTPPKAATPAAPVSVAAKAPTEDDLAKAAAIRDEIASIDKAITMAQGESEKLGGGLIKARIEARIAQMRYTISLLQTRKKAYELGAKLVPVEVSVSGVDAVAAERLEKDIEAQRTKIAEMDAKASQYSGGLIRAQILSTSATMSETLALLEQRMMVAKYGLVLAPGIKPGPDISTETNSASVPSQKKPQVPKEAPLADTIVKVRLTNKEYKEQKYDKSIFFSGEYLAEGLDKPARSIKGAFKVQDLFGETKVAIGWTLTQPLSPGESQYFSGKGIDYNQFINSHQWLRSTSSSDMQVVFSVQSIIYEDGTKRDF